MKYDPFELNNNIIIADIRNHSSNQPIISKWDSNIFEIVNEFGYYYDKFVYP